MGPPGKGGMGGIPRPPGPGAVVASWLDACCGRFSIAVGEVRLTRNHALRKWGRAGGHAGKGRRYTSREGEGRREGLARLVLRQHRVVVRLAFGGVGRRDGVDDGLRLLMADFWKRKAPVLVVCSKYREALDLGGGRETYVGSSRRRCGGGFDRCCAPFARSWSHASGRRRSNRLGNLVSRCRKIRAIASCCLRMGTLQKTANLLAFVLMRDGWRGDGELTLGHLCG